MMERRILGKTGLEVGILGLGGANHLQAGQEELIRIIDKAEEVGANCLDLYWNCEELVAKALQGRRGKFVLISKIEITQKALDKLPEGKRGTVEQIEESLRRLSTDYIDVCQLHYVNSDDAFDELCIPEGTLSMMLKAQQEGKVRFLGITSHHPTVLARAIKTGYFATLMVPFNVARRQFGQDPSLGLFELAQRLNVGVIIMKPIAYGRMYHNIPRALQFIWAHSVTVAIPGATSLAQWELDIAAAQQFSIMTSEERNRCRDEGWLLQSSYCTGCRYCLPCPSEMNLPELMRMERYTDVFGLTEWLSEERVGKLFVDTSQCGNCGVCEERCPRDLPIIERLGNCQNYLN
jgi:predicted aldo/keto reductase-like oxidoreductase